jgi:phosphonoacetaldehyde hydrolase
MKAPTQQNHLRAVVLDWAGTTVDFGCMAPVCAFQELFERYGVAAAEADVRRFMGYDKREHLRLLLDLPHIATEWADVHGELPSPDDFTRIYEEAELMLEDVVERFAEPIPGAVELVERLRGRGLRIGSTTGYTKRIMERLVRSAGALGYSPDVCVTADEVPAGRPAPFMCYLTALRLEAYPLQCMVKVGDTTADIQEGRNAGMWTVGVAIGGSDLGLTRSEVEALPPEEVEARVGIVQQRHLEAGAHYVLRTLDELEPVLDLIEQRMASGGHPLEGRQGGA